MGNKLFTLILILTLFKANSQILPTDPVPGCTEIQRAGVTHSDGYSTHNWVWSSSTDDSGCDSLNITVSGPMYSGDYAYGIVQIDQLTQTTQDEVDFSIELTGVFQSLPLYQDIVVAQFLNGGLITGELSLRKVPDLTAVVGNLSSKTFYKWVLKVRWFNGSLVEHSDDIFAFNPDDEILFNYVWDEIDPNLPVSMFFLGNNMTSINPYTSSQTGITQNANGSGEIKIFHFGIINDDVLLLDGDHITFDLNLINSDIIITGK